MDPVKMNVDLSQVLGCGTHGTVYQSTLNPNLAVKVVTNTTLMVPQCPSEKKIQIDVCKLIGAEYQAQEIIFDALEKYRFQLPGGELLRIPQVHGFSFSPSTYSAKYCSYLMEKIPKFENMNKLIQIPLGYDRTYQEENSSGIYMGIETLLEFLKLPAGSEVKIVQAMASLHALFHFGIGCDGYDVEYVVSKNSENELQIYAFDFDKVSFYTGPYKQLSDPENNNCVMRKLTEDNYEQRSIQNERDIVKFLATSFSYDPCPNYPEYPIWKETYLAVAELFGQKDQAERVLEMRLIFF